MRIICCFLCIVMTLGVFVSCKKPEYNKEAEKVVLDTKVITNATTTIKDVGDVKPVQGSSVEEEAAEIILNSGETTVSANGASFENGTLMITKAGTYVLSGTLDEGAIVVNTEDTETVKLIFNGVSITNSKTSPITVINAQKRVTIHIQKNSVNKIVDSAKNKNGEYGEDAAIVNVSAFSIIKPHLRPSFILHTAIFLYNGFSCIY